MSQRTTNYNLYMEDDDSVDFLTWRNNENGVDETSNIQVIDRVLGEKADKSAEVSGTLLASDWVGEEAPYTQEISVEGLEAGQGGSIGLAQNATTEQRQAAREAVITVLDQDDGSLAVVADGDKPAIDIPFVITIFG